MTFAIKTTTQVQAWELGAGSEKEREMLRDGKIIAHSDGTFEIFTKEATGTKGQIAKAGDYFKVDERGFQCPNRREYFLQNHQHLEGNWFIQIARPLKIWHLGDPECEELRFLLNKGFISIHPEDKEHCFSALLWGTKETAASDAVVVFYSVKNDPEGKISAVDFNFVDAEYFSTHYRIITSYRKTDRKAEVAVQQRNRQEGANIMDKDWAQMNKEMQALLSKETTFKDAISKLIKLRGSLFEQITQIVNAFPEEAFWQMPFAGADGYHSKTLAYSIWHIFRIEDIVAHEMITEDQQILFAQGFDKTVHSPIITTGNELSGNEIAEFSKELNVKELYRYAQAVTESTHQILAQLQYTDLKRRFGEEMIAKLQSTGCISEDENANWLIAYWCGKDVRGLIKMPFSRHWIMHIEAMRRIKNKLCKTARKGVDPVAYCGLSCNHCFLGEWCGSCRTSYNTCSNATLSPDRICPNVKCCKEKGFDGCYECDNLEFCEKGFYVPSNDGANAAKAQSLYIRNHGKKEFLKVHDRLHQKYDFSKTQEILGQDYHEGLRILEEN